MKRHGDLFDRMTSFAHLMRCARRAARGKRHRTDVFAFRVRMERHVLEIQAALRNGTWRPGAYREFRITHPKPRLISAAPFADRVVHHALVDVLEPIWERSFIHDSYACRAGKGTHQAVRRYRLWARAHPYFLKMDVRKFFPSIDHDVLFGLLQRKVKDRRVLDLARRIIDSSNPQDAVDLGFPDDAAERRRGLPIGNQTSQFFANVYLDPLDHFVKDRLGVRRYLRYCDDLVILGDSASALHQTRARLEAFAERLRLRFNPRKCFTAPVTEGLRLLGYRVWPDRVRVAADSVSRFRRRLRRQQRDLESGATSLDRVHASVQAWIGHAAHADSWRLRERILSDLSFMLPAAASGCGAKGG